MKRNAIVFLSIMLLCLTRQVEAQVVDTSFAQKEIDFTTYIGLVGKNNLAYSAEKFNVDIAEANELVSGLFPDPELEFGWFDNGQRRMKMGYGFSSELSWVVELGGKRKARLNVAQNETMLTKLLLEEYFKDLRADATLAYIEAIYNKLLLDAQVDSYHQMRKLADSDSVRFQLGSITRVDARQSKLEAGTMLNEVYSIEADWKLSLANLSLLLGNTTQDTLWKPSGVLEDLDRDFSLSELIVTAQDNRTSLKVALQDKNLSSSMMSLAQADRATDLGISLGMEYGSYVNNIIAPTPSYTSVSAGLSIPLKFSNKRSGDLKVAQYNLMQAEKNYNQTELQIQVEVTQAYYFYKSVQNKLDNLIQV